MLRRTIVRPFGAELLAFALRFPALGGALRGSGAASCDASAAAASAAAAGAGVGVGAGVGAAARALLLLECAAQYLVRPFHRGLAQPSKQQTEGSIRVWGRGGARICRPTNAGHSVICA